MSFTPIFSIEFHWAVILFSVILSGIVSMGTCHLLLLHIWLINSGLTTYEWLKKKSAAVDPTTPASIILTTSGTNNVSATSIKSNFSLDNDKNLRIQGALV